MDNPLISDETPIEPTREPTKSEMSIAINNKLMEELNRLKNEKLQREIDELKANMQPKPVVKKKPVRKKVVKKVEEKELEPLVHPSVQPLPITPIPRLDVPVPKPFFLKRLFTRKTKVIPHPPVSIAPIQKDSIACQDMEFADVKFCPKCSAKLSKSPVFATDTNLVQYVKCSDIKCDFYKKIEFKR